MPTVMASTNPLSAPNYSRTFNLHLDSAGCVLVGSVTDIGCTEAQLIGNFIVNGPVTTITFDSGSYVTDFHSGNYSLSGLHSFSGTVTITLNGVSPPTVSNTIIHD